MKKPALAGLAAAFFILPVNVIAQDKSPQQAANVIVAVAKKEKLADRVEALGTLRANETVTLTATVTETITAINFTDGQRVEKGQVLVEMASGEEKAQLDQARALAGEASRQLERVKNLVKNNAASESALDERKRDYDAAQARLRETESKLGNYLITAPFAGVLGLRNLSVGALLQPGSKITSIDDDSVMKLDFAVPSVFQTDLKPGAPIAATAREFGKTEFKGQVSSVDSQIDPVTRSITVRALLPNEAHMLKPGLLMSVILFSNPRESVVVPENALIPEGQDNYVLAVDDSAPPAIAQKKKVVIGMRQPGEVEIIQGLAEGEKVVTHGSMNARPGQPVKVLAIEKGGEDLSTLLDKADNATDGQDKKGKD